MNTSGAFTPYKKPVYKREDARYFDKGEVENCSKFPFSRRNLDISVDYAGTSEYMEDGIYGDTCSEPCDGFSGDEDGHDEQAEIDERLYLFSVMDDWYKERRKEREAAKVLANMACESVRK